MKDTSFTQSRKPAGHKPNLSSRPSFEVNQKKVQAQNSSNFAAYVEEQTKLEQQKQQQMQQQQAQKPDSHYKGSLASQKYFTPQELNSLAQIKGTRPQSGKRRVNEELKRQESLQSKQSLPQVPGATPAIMSAQQDDKLKKLGSRPFSVKSNKPIQKRQEDGSSQKENHTLNAIEDGNASFEEVTEIDTIGRQQFLKQLEEHEKNRQDLFDAFEDFKRVMGRDPTEEPKMTTKPLYQPEERVTGSSFYKPDLKAKKPPSSHQTQRSTIKDGKPQQLPSIAPKMQAKGPVKPQHPQSDNPISAIEARILALQSEFAEVKEGMEEFLDDVESLADNNLVQIPEDQDEQVEILVNEHREEVLDEDGKPFWQKFFKADYLEEKTDRETKGTATEMALGLEAKAKAVGVRMEDKLKGDELKKYQRMMALIRKNDATLAGKQKLLRDLKEAKRVREGQQLQTVQTVPEEAKKQRPPSATSSKASSSKGFVSKPSSGSKLKREKDNSSTFLTGMPFTGAAKKPRESSLKKGSKSKTQVVADEADSEIADQDELQDVVYDFERGQMLLEQADGFLQGKDPVEQFLALPPSDTRGLSVMATGEAGGSRMAAMNYSLMQRPKKCDKLDESQQQKLQVLLEDTEDQEKMEEMKKLKLQEDSDAMSFRTEGYQSLALMSGVDPSAYHYDEAAQRRLEEINSSLNNFVPMIAGDTSQASTPAKAINESKIELNSVAGSVAVSHRSNFTMLSANTMGILSGINKGPLPRVQALKDKAEQRRLENQMKMIDSHLDQINNTDDLSYAIKGAEPAVQDLDLQVAVVEKKLIDKETLNKLIDDTREEVERMREIDAALEKIPKELPQNQSLREAEEIMTKALSLQNEIEFSKEEVNEEEERQKAEEQKRLLSDIEASNKLILQQSEKVLAQSKEKKKIAEKFDEQQKEMLAAIEKLEKREEELNQQADKDREWDEQFSQQVSKAREMPKQLEQIKEEEEDDDTLSKIMADIQNFQKLQQEETEHRIQAQQHSEQLLNQVLKEQTERGGSQEQVQEAIPETFEHHEEERKEEEQKYDPGVSGIPPPPYNFIKMVEAGQPKETFEPVTPLFDISFWLQFMKLKLDTWKLSNPQCSIYGKIGLPVSQNHSTNLLIDHLSFREVPEAEIEKNQSQGGLLSQQIKGIFFHTNTIEEFQGLDLAKLAIEINDKNEGHQFFLAIFGDLKGYNFYYKFNLIESNSDYKIEKANKLAKFLQEDQIKRIEGQVQAFSSNSEINENQCLKLNKVDDQTSLDLQDYDQGKQFLCFIDSSPKLPCVLLKLILDKQEKEEFEVISIRDKISKLKTEKPVILQTSLYLKISRKVLSKDLRSSHGSLREGKLCLKDQMDPNQLAIQAAGLNLKLMKWRMQPELNLDVMQNTSCLLLGSGSLGCQVARNLVSWGYKKLTFVDYGRVAYSNPVRQCLFTFQDSQERKPKAFTAAERLKEVYPGVEVEGHQFSIPMPGHSAGSTEEAIKDTLGNMQKLEELIQKNDVIFLLLDSREARWLPAVMAGVYNKICLTVALGFDSYLVMRHGMPKEFHDPTLHGNQRLGCYFCNDVVAPRDSMSDRTLDQQCTVSRPALCTIASAQSVELLTSLLQHPLRQGAQAKEKMYDCDRTCLGLLPQQIRGDLNNFSSNILYGEAFDKCIACSKEIIEEFKKDKEQFLLQACGRPDYLEDLTGITKMMNEVDLDAVEMLDDFDEDDM